MTNVITSFWSRGRHETQRHRGFVEPIWNDMDVAEIIGSNLDGSVGLRLGRLDPTSLRMMMDFIEADQAVGQDRAFPPSFGHA